MLINSVRAKRNEMETVPISGNSTWEMKIDLKMKTNLLLAQTNTNNIMDIDQPANRQQPHIFAHIASNVVLKSACEKLIQNW